MSPKKEALKQLVFQPELCREEEFRWTKHREVVYIPKMMDIKQPLQTLAVGLLFPTPVDAAISWLIDK
jgi:hypothetical protein